MTLAWWVLLAGRALAQDAYLASEPLATRDEAQAMVDAGVEAGCPAEVARRYLKGEGWRYVVRLLPAADPLRCAEGPWGPGVVLRSPQESSGRRAGRDEPPPPTERPLPWTVDEVLSRLVRAHDGASGGAEGGGTVLFRFVRRTAGGGVVEHTYVRRGEDRYLRVDVREGEGVSSRSGIVAGTAWLEGSTVPLDAGLVREQIDRFSPRSVLQLASMLAGGSLDLPERPFLRVIALQDGPDGEVVVVGADGDRLSPPLRLEVDARTWRLRRVVRGTEGASVAWRYEGWRETEDGALRPLRVTVERGSTVIDSVEVSELELSPVVPDEWFRAPPAP